MTIAAWAVATLAVVWAARRAYVAFRSETPTPREPEPVFGADAEEAP